jgi:cellulose synthase/poly-beta-1,6-N-acetylglucosamine synthase-like glycosyltransferase
MEVKTVAETDFSWRVVVKYVTIGSLLVIGLLVPVLVVEEYARVLNTLILLSLLGLGGRALLSALITFDYINPPPIPTGTDLPMVSVIIPAYNEGPVLPGTISACKNLDYPAEKLEFIVCYEPNSTDNTEEIAEQAAAHDSRFKAMRQHDTQDGKAEAINYALRYATGDIIALIDADHQFKADALRRAVAWFLANDNIWCVSGRCYGANPTDSILALHATVERHMVERAELFARQVIHGFTIFGGGQAFFRAALFDELGDFDGEMLVEDIDMSSRIHAHGKELLMDPRIITYEENPATVSAWWNQRKRWARGWMQVAVRYLPIFSRNSSVTLRKRLDAVYTLFYGVIPAFLILAFPMYFLGTWSDITTTSYIPYDWVLWSLVAIVPVATLFIVFIQDWQDGHSHHRREYIASFTIWFYLVLQATIYVVAFIEEFVLRKPNVFVTTSRSEKQSEESLSD